MMMTNDLIRRPALYPGLCTVCKARFEPGTEILWNKALKQATHANAGVCEAEMEGGEILQAESEREMEHRMNCDDPACTTRCDPEYADVLLDEYDRLMDRVDACLDQYDAMVRVRAAAALPKGIYRISFDAEETDHVNVQIRPRPGGKNLDVREWRGAYVGKFLTEDLKLKDDKVLKAGAIDYALGVNPKDRVVSRVVRGLDVLLGTADPIKYSESFAVAAHACMRCGRDLVDAESRARVLGPECARMMDR